MRHIIGLFYNIGQIIDIRLVLFYSESTVTCRKESMKRNLTVYKKTELELSEYQMHQSKLRIIPQIILQGKYLEQFGFQPGQKITVELSEEKIIITKAT